MKKNNLCAGLGLAAVLLVPMVFVVNPAVSQESRGDAASDEPLDQIVVVAHKSERSVRDIAANVTVLTAEEINANLATSVADMFRYSPGVDYEAAGSRFGTEGINIRGIGGNRVAILVDGVPMSDQFDVGSFSNATRDFLNAGLVNRVEVLHGPASALYGSAAIGGVGSPPGLGWPSGSTQELESGQRCLARPTMFGRVAGLYRTGPSGRANDVWPGQ